MHQPNLLVATGPASSFSFRITYGPASIRVNKSRRRHSPRYCRSRSGTMPTLQCGSKTNGDLVAGELASWHPGEVSKITEWPNATTSRAVSSSVTESPLAIRIAAVSRATPFSLRDCRCSPSIRSGILTSTNDQRSKQGLRRCEGLLSGAVRRMQTIRGRLSAAGRHRPQFLMF